VTISSYLLYATALCQLASLVITLAYLGTQQRVLRQAGGATADAATTNAIATVVALVVGLLIVAALVVLAVLNMRGRNAARITTWVLGGLSLCCVGAGSAATALLSSVDTTGSGTVSPAELQRRVDAALPAWYGPVTNTLAVLSGLALLGALILLALPPSNAFFRKPAPAGWTPTPPYPGQPYPGQPYPGQSYPPQPPSDGGWGTPPGPPAG
jgi:hypothetical protein